MSDDALALVMIECPEKPDLVGQVFPLTPGKQHFVGRPPSACGAVDGKDRLGVLFMIDSLTRNHAQLDPDGSGGWLLSDRGSTNGTFLNEEKLHTSSRRPVKVGDRLRFGQAVLELRHL